MGSFSGRFSEHSGLGIGLFQQNYGVLTTFGGIVNFAYNARLARDSNLTFGLNVGAYKSGINSGNVVTNFADPSLNNIPSNFLLTINPGINYGTGFMDFGLSINNLALFNTSELIEDNPGQTVQGHIMYTGYLNMSGFFEESKFSGLVRSEFKKDKTVVSGLAMLTVPKGIWAQVGYNNLYGASGGIGMNITKQIAIEYNFEKALGNLTNFGPSHEITLAYKLKNNEKYRYSREDDVSALFSGDGKKPVKNVNAEENRILAEEAKAEAKLEVEAIAEAKIVADAKAKADAEAKAEADKIKIAEAQAKAEAKAIADAQAKVDAEAAKLAAEAQATEVAEAKAKIASENKAKADAKAKAEAEAARLAEAARVKAAAEAQAKLDADKVKADAKAKAEAEAARLAEVARLKAAADAQAKLDADKVKVDAKAKADAEAVRLAEIARVKAATDAQAKLDAEKEAIAIAKAKADAESAKAKEAAKAIAEADAQAKLDAENRAKEEAKIKADAETARLAEEARIKAEVDAQAKLIAEAKAKEDIIANPKDDIAKSMNSIEKLTEAAEAQQKELLAKYSEAIKNKDEDLKDLKEENDLSDQGIVMAPKPFKSVTAENVLLEGLKVDLNQVITTRNDRIKELETLYEKRLKIYPLVNDEVNLYYQKSIKKLKAEQLTAMQTKTALTSSLETIKEATEFERKRRIKRAAFDSEQDRFTQDRQALSIIKQNTQLSSVPLKAEDFDSGEEQSNNIQILKNVKNVENGYYLIVAVHNDVAKRDDFVRKAVASGRTDIDFFFDVNTSKYYIYYQKFENIEEANEALKSKGSRPFNGKMSITKIEN